MSEVGSRDDDRVDVRIVGDLVHISRLLGRSPVLLSLVEQLFIRIAHRDQFASLVEPNPRHMVIVRNGPGPDDRNADFVRHG